MDSTWLLWSSLFSLIGLAIFVYGRRQRRGVPLVVGIVLMVYSYFISNAWVLVGIGLLLIAVLVVGNRLEDSL
jgi:predicted membrane protein